MRRELVAAVKAVIDAALTTSWFTAPKDVVLANPKEAMEDTMLSFPLILIAPSQSQTINKIGLDRHEFYIDFALCDRGAFSQTDDITYRQLDFVDFIEQTFPRTTLISFSWTVGETKTTMKLRPNILAETYENPIMLRDAVDMKVTVPIRFELIK